ncbi:Uncharacterized protein TCM_029619 [Theobroma cacao]|uniref:Uncharacterized protein n=1 Tax=Theobroma cacao TaxID=3641 RepID=A0A061GLB7_THECC|nr:Uncharacterized protein TCM_029619 [Theobroma cacao]
MISDFLRRCNFARMLFSKAMILLSAVLALSWIGTHKLEAAMLPEDEVNVLNQIARTMGATNWTFDGDDCQKNDTPRVERGFVPEKNVTCHCENETCHVTHFDERREAVMLRTTYFMKGFGLFVIRKSPMDPSEPSLSFVIKKKTSNS